MINLTEMLSVSPKFDKDLLNEIVRKAAGDNFSILNITIDSNSKKGDSYLSTVCRFEIQVVKNDDKNQDEAKTLHIITKGLPKNIARRKTYRSVDFFDNEVIFYNVVWSTLRDFQKSKNVESFSNIPECYYALADGSNDLVVLEDVSFKGFRGITRSTGLDLLHTVTILKIFARFHGTSLAFKLECPDKFQEISNSLKETYFAEKFRPWYTNFQKRNIEIVRDAVEKELNETYLKKFDQIVSGDFYGNICKLCAQKGKFAVICHGDAWVPNFLMKYNDDDDKPTEGMMIDFQLARCASLAQDLLFFLYSCTTQNLRDQYWDILLSEYYTELQITLKKLGSDINFISLEDIKDELKENALFGVGMSTEAITMSLLDDDEIAEIDMLQGDDAHPLENVWIIHPFKVKEKRVRISSIFKDAIDRGYFPN